MPPKAKTSWADLPDLTVSVSWNLIRRSMKVGEGMMEPPPVNHSTHPTKQGSTEDKAGAKKKKKPEPENPENPKFLAGHCHQRQGSHLAPKDGAGHVGRVRGGGRCRYH